MSEHKKDATGHNGHGDPVEKKSGAMNGWLMMIPIIFVGIIIIKFLFPSEEKTRKPSGNDYRQPTEQGYNLQVPKSKHVVYGPKFGKIIYLPKGWSFYFSGATQPYCYVNDDNEGDCGAIDEDASTGGGHANQKLRFKSQNDETGELDIVFIPFKEIDDENN